MTDHVPTSNIPDYVQPARQFIADNDWNDDEAEERLAALLLQAFTDGQNSILLGASVVDQLPVNTSE